MRLFFDIFNRAKRVAIRTQPAPQPPEPLFCAVRAPDWLPEDAANWARFLSTGTGQTLRARMGALEALNAVKGCQDAFHTVHSAGRAAGFSDCAAWLLSLAQIPETISPVAGDQATNPNPQRRDAPLREHFAS